MPDSASSSAAPSPRPSSPGASDAALTEALDAVRPHVAEPPRLALVLGSGLGALADDAEDAVVVEASDIPHYPQSTVHGHHGRLVFGTLEGTPVVFIQGRVHMYEAYRPTQLTFPIRLVHALGAEHLLVTNSAGGIHRTFSPGTLMFLTGHLNFAFASPLAGIGVPPRRPAPDEPPSALRHRPYYDVEWRKRAEAVALDAGLDTKRGTYAWVLGPSYETKAEIRALEHFGADAVGMSTVPEVVQAQQLGMSVLGISTITNPAAGKGADTLDHDEVLEVGAQVRDDLAALVRGIVRETLR